MVTLDTIAETVSKEMGYSEMELLSHRRRNGVVLARWVMYYLARELTPNSTPAIGRRFNRDHTTILYGIKKAEKRIGENIKYRELIQRIEGNLSKGATC